MDIRVTRTFTVNNKVYRSIDELPNDLRALVEQQATGSPAGAAGQGPPSATQTKIVFNGTEYDGLNSLPPEARQLYEAAMKAAARGVLSANVTIQMNGRGSTVSLSPRFLIGTLIVTALIILAIVRLLGNA